MPHLYPENQTYGIINTSDLASVDFVKWEETHIPTFITDGTIAPVSILSHELCLELMQTPEWSEPMPVIE